MGRARRLSPDELRPYLLDVPNPHKLSPAALAAWEQAAPPRPLAWPALFGSDRPVEVEVGFGKGLFLLTAGVARPDVNFLGIEIERKYALHTAARLARRGVGNVKLAATDAHWFLKEWVADASTAGVHVYFPDPWWKQRHRKRRLLTPDFAEECFRVLRPGGLLHFVTDVQEYFEETLSMLAGQGRFRPLPLPDEPGPSAYLTNFERKYRQEGRPIYRALFERPQP